MAHVEILATSAIEQRLGRCEHLVPIIDSNDKTPITDGFIDVYMGLGRRSEDITARLPVQVKGLTARTRNPPTTYSMTRTQLSTVRNHGTVLLFAVFVRPDGSYFGEPKYAILAPYTIDMWVNQTPLTKKSVAVPLRDLPEDSSEIEGIVNIAVLSQRQRMFEGQTGSVLDNATSITIHATKPWALDGPITFSPEHGDYVIEAETTLGMVPLPGVLELRPGSYVEHQRDVTVRCGEVEYRGATLRQVDARSWEMKPSPGITLSLVFEDERLKTSSIVLSQVDGLVDRVKDIDFFLSLADTKSISFNGGHYTFEMSQFQDPSDLRAARNNLGRLLELFDKLHVDARLIDMAEIDSQQHTRLRYLYASVVQNRSLNADNGQIAYVSEQLGPWQLSLFVLPAAEPGTWKYVDPFAPENRRQFRLYSMDDNGKGEEITGTVYDGIKQEDLPLVLNLHLDALVDAYRTIAELPETSYLATQFLLKLIQAADVEPRRREEFLDAATSLNEWLIEEDPESIPNTLNRYQIRARRPSGLTATDLSEIRSLRREIITSAASTAPVHEIGCAILLGDPADINDCAQRLTEKELEDLLAYPIWNLVSTPAPEIEGER